VFADAQVLNREMVISVHHPTAGEVRMVGLPLKLSVTPGAVRRPPPLLAQHTFEVLTEAGYSEIEIASLAERGAIALTPAT